MSAPAPPEVAPVPVEDPLAYADNGTTSNNTKTHVINPTMNTAVWAKGMTAQEIIDKALASDLQLVALCGYKWIPSDTTIRKFDLCTVCLSRVKQITNGG